MLRGQVQSGKKEKRKKAKLHGNQVVDLLRNRNSLAASHCVHRDSSIHGNHEFKESIRETFSQKQLHFQNYSPCKLE